MSSSRSSTCAWATSTSRLFVSLRRRALAFSFPSGAGRSLRSLGYAPCGAARSRVLRTCGPALFVLDSSSVAGNARRTMVRCSARGDCARIAPCRTKTNRTREFRQSGAPRSSGCRLRCVRPSMRRSPTPLPSTRSRPASAPPQRRRPSRGIPLIPLIPLISLNPGESRQNIVFCARFSPSRTPTAPGARTVRA